MEMLERGWAVSEVIESYTNGILVAEPAHVLKWFRAGADAIEFYRAYVLGLVKGKITPAMLVQMDAKMSIIMALMADDMLTRTPTFYEWLLLNADITQLVVFMEKGWVSDKPHPSWLWVANASVSQMIWAAKRKYITGPINPLELGARGATPDLILQAAREGLVAMDTVLATEWLANYFVESKVHEGAWKRVTGSCVVCLETSCTCLALCKGSRERHGHFVCSVCIQPTLSAAMHATGRLSCPMCRSCLL